MQQITQKYFILIVILTIGHSTTTESLRIMTYNIRHGQNMRDIIDLDAIANVLNNYSPDLVALQEVDYKTNRTDYVDQCGYIGNNTVMHYFFSAHREYDSGLYGNCILSKSRINYNYSLPMPHVDVARPAQPITVAVISVNLSSAQEIVFLCAHLDYRSDPTNRKLQVNKLLVTFNDTDVPVIIGGDFNAVPTTDEISEMKSGFADFTENIGNTFPSDKPDRRIDYVFISEKFRNDFKVIESKVIPETVASDHRPVYVEINLI